MAFKMAEKQETNNKSEMRATILGIGTAVPTNCIHQSQYQDFYFRVTNSQHMTYLKQKLENICKKSGIQKRYFHLKEDILKANPNICKYGAPSLDARQEMMEKEVPKLGKEAALKAIEEWGQPISKITHLIVSTSSANCMPGIDTQLSNLLGLNPSVQRTMLFQIGCHSAGSCLRLAKDVVENSNNVGSRFLVVCIDITTMYFHAPSETHLDILVGQAIFSDGAAAMIIGANPNANVEPGLFRIVSALQIVVPNSGDGIVGNMGEMGFSYHLSRNVPNYVGQYIKKCLVDAFGATGMMMDELNSLFYVVHPGGCAILDEIEVNLGLQDGKLEASRHVLGEYGNMAGPTVVFVLDEMRKKSMREGKMNTGEGLKSGLLITFGPGITMETFMLQSLPLFPSLNYSTRLG